jgi:hypothetical protein
MLICGVSWRSSTAFGRGGIERRANQSKQDIQAENPGKERRAQFELNANGRQRRSNYGNVERTEKNTTEQDEQRTPVLGWSIRRLCSRLFNWLMIRSLGRFWHAAL